MNKDSNQEVLPLEDHDACNVERALKKILLLHLKVLMN
jgi:hypothetical protein